ncbi:MAG: tetratricopeptide repeat protein, partial [Pedobacter sp.]
MRLTGPGIILLLHFCLSCGMMGFGQPQRDIDSLRRIVSDSHRLQDIPVLFRIADNFMELDQYDSAQVWLNYVANMLPLRKPSLFNYFLSTRQAEIYYYNGLQRLGLQEAERSLQIATTLNDSLLLADSYNFLGLFYMNLDSTRKSIGFFREGMAYAKDPPYPANYLSLSKPYHLAGNLAEAYVKLGSYDSALILSRRSLQLATKLDVGRGIGVASNLIGTILLKQYQEDSAIAYQQAAINITIQSLDYDVALIAYGGLAAGYAENDEKAAAFEALKNGFSLLHDQPHINNFFYGQFLEDALAVYRKYDDREMLIYALDEKSTLATKRLKKNDLQMNT